MNVYTPSIPQCDYADISGRCKDDSSYMISFNTVDVTFSAFNPFAPGFPTTACRPHALSALLHRGRPRAIVPLDSDGSPIIVTQAPTRRAA